MRRVALSKELTGICLALLIGIGLFGIAGGHCPSASAQYSKQWKFDRNVDHRACSSMLPAESTRVPVIENRMRRMHGATEYILSAIPSFVCALAIALTAIALATGIAPWHLLNQVRVLL